MYTHKNSLTQSKSGQVHIANFLKKQQNKVEHFQQKSGRRPLMIKEEGHTHSRI